MRYRAEIDGLRALAVIPVVLFHSGHSSFSGGFIGVDIFFVISGFLITSKILKDINKKVFSLVGFYERRVRRLLPALFFVMVCSIPFAWFLMMPSEINTFSQSLISVCIMASNIFFWRTTGYFQVSNQSPLIHTWSLAVEEQYYIFFPILLLVLLTVWRLNNNRVLFIIVVISLISFLISEWGWRYQPTASFYLAPSRAWEILSGSILAFYVEKYGCKKNNFLAMLGLVVIVGSILFFDRGIPFPSHYTLFPVLGTVLFILYGEKQTFAAKVLSTKPLVGIGLISYSLYLWHQPIFAFYGMHFEKTEKGYIITSLVILCILMSILTWFFIEKPFRKREIVSGQKVLGILSFFLLIIMSFAVITWLNLGDLGRWPKQLAKFQELVSYSQIYNLKRNIELREVYFDQTKKKILIIGDSNAGDFLNMVESEFGEDKFSISTLHISAGCGNLYLPKSDFVANRRKIDKECVGRNLLAAKSESLIDEANLVVLASAWQKWEVKKFGESYRNLRNKFGDKFMTFGTKTVEFKPIKALKNGVSIDGPIYSDLTKDTIQINAELLDITKERFISPSELHCNKSNKCLVIDRKNNTIQYDNFHLTPFGARFLGSKIRSKIDFFLSNIEG